MRSDSSSKLAKVTGLGDLDGVAVVSELGETEKDSSRRQIAFVFPVFNSRDMSASCTFFGMMLLCFGTCNLFWDTFGTMFMLRTFAPVQRLKVVIFLGTFGTTFMVRTFSRPYRLNINSSVRE